MFTYIFNIVHNKEVLSWLQSMKYIHWIDTADKKDLYVEAY